MKTLKTNNEMNYKVLFESAMDRIAELEQELAELKSEMANNEPIAEPTDATQVIREQIVYMLYDGDAGCEFEPYLVDAVNDCGVWEHYVRHNDKGLHYVLENVFDNNLEDFLKWTNSECYYRHCPYLIVNGKEILCAEFDIVDDSLEQFIMNKELCTDEVLDRIIASLDSNRAW